jgi:hypothetical protein
MASFGQEPPTSSAAFPLRLRFGHPSESLAYVRAGAQGHRGAYMRILDRIAKRAGLYVSRPLLNAESWVKWATAAGVPNVVPAEKMHVTVIASRTDVKTRPMTGTHQVYTQAENACWAPGDGGRFELLGPNADVLAYVWSCDWALIERCGMLQEMGATSDWPSYRPHVTISYDAKGFELTDEALATMPPSLLFGPEVFGPFDPAVAVKKAWADEEGVTLEAAAIAEAAAFVAKGEGWNKLSVHERQTIALLAAGQAVAKADLAALDGKVAFLTAPAAPPAPIFKVAREEERMVYGFASVSMAETTKFETQDGHVVDSHDDLITTKALRSLARGIAMGQRAGKFDHKGAKKTEIVEQVVFDADLWKAMGQYFEDTGVCTPEQAAVFKAMTFEGLLQGFYVEDDAVWQMAKDSEFELSIGAERAAVRSLTDAG